MNLNFTQMKFPLINFFLKTSGIFFQKYVRVIGMFYLKTIRRLLAKPLFMYRIFMGPKILQQTLCIMSVIFFPHYSSPLCCQQKMFVLWVRAAVKD